VPRSGPSSITQLSHQILVGHFSSHPNGIRHQHILQRDEQRPFQMIRQFSDNAFGILTHAPPTYLTPHPISPLQTTGCFSNFPANVSTTCGTSNHHSSSKRLMRVAGMLGVLGRQILDSFFSLTTPHFQAREVLTNSGLVNGYCKLNISKI
jgi:hypothetical protein